MKASKAAVVAKNTTSELKAMLEMTALIQAKK